MNVLNPPPQVQQPQQRYYQPPHQRPQHVVTPPSDSGLSEIKIAQISSTLQTRQQGALLSQLVQPTEYVNTITLRSGSHYDGPPMPKDDEHDKPQDKSGDMQGLAIKLPLPYRYLKSKLDNQFGKFLKVVNNLQVTVPFTDLITRVPAYSKFMKENLTRKTAISEVETVAFTAECSAILLNKSPPNLKDPATNISLQMADRSVKYPLGALEDVPVREK
ncbi:uncharacterized protein LOC110685440 [Chenopodium quinoa]|uniref:uncharacterized protein LOC110685440 n=1 Tax=Chenopodium quinoa TaxID=63459 RepID=UPI000B79128B|nr:uncharacterized protein LOC110685440 [Chenopodium quinoa]